MYIYVWKDYQNSLKLWDTKLKEIIYTMLTFVLNVGT